MAGAIYKRGKRYWFKFYLRGQGQIRKPLIPDGKNLATTSRAVAENLAKTMRRDYGLATTASPSALSGLVEGFEREFVIDCVPETVKRFVSVVHRFLASQKIVVPAQITVQAIKGYLATLTAEGLSAKTKATHKSALSCFCEYLIGEGQMRENPALSYRLKRRGGPLPVVVPDASVDALLARAEGHPLHDAILVAADCGLRVGELRAMNRSWLNFTDGLIHVGGDDPTVTKARRPRVVKMSPRVRKAMKAYVGTKPQEALFWDRSQWSWINAMRTLTAGLDGFSARPGMRTGRLWHALRAYAALTRARAGMKPYQIMLEMGWQHESQLRHYISIAAAAKQATRM
jgi:integrase